MVRQSVVGRQPLELIPKGIVRDGLFRQEDLGVPVSHIVDVTRQMLSKLTSQERDKVQYPINASEWRCWSNPEFLLRPFGLRLEEVPEDVAEAILSVIETTFSPAGYRKVLAAMRVNHFLGECCDVLSIMNKYSYNFLLFGTPSATDGWGWTLYGHHLCLAVFLKERHIVVSPTFTGAEPNLIDTGPWAGTMILHAEGQLGLQLMQSLSAQQQSDAQTFKLLHDPGMKLTGDLISDRWNQDDQRHLCGAFRDNRIVPYEGVLVADFNKTQQRLVLDIANEMTIFLPDKARQRRLEQIQQYFSETFFSWIGEYGDDDPFYFRIQSPVVILEFDHHSGVFLTNKEPAKYHTHTIVRTPNAGDYGQAVRSATERLA